MCEICRFMALSQEILTMNSCKNQQELISMNRFGMYYRSILLNLVQ